MTLEKPQRSQRAQIAETLSDAGLTVRSPMIQQTRIWIEPEAMPHCYGSMQGISVTFGAGHSCWQVIIDPAVYGKLRFAMNESERKRKRVAPVRRRKISLFPWRRWRSRSPAR